MPRHRILIVDDIQDNIDTIKVILASESFDTVEACGGEEALSLLKDHAVDLVLSDMLMPKMDGIELTHAIRTQMNDQLTPIIIITAAGDDPDLIAKALSTGANDYLARPYNKIELQARINACIRLRDLTLQIERKNEELDRAYSKLKQVQAQLIAHAKSTTVSTLTRGIGQEFNKQFSIINGYTQLAKITDDLKTHSNAFDIILDACESAKKILATLNALSDSPKPSPQSIDPNQAIQAQLTIIEPQLRQKGVSVDCQFNATHPVLFGKDALQHVLFQTITNACHAMPDGGKIVIRTIDMAPYVHLYIEDTGSGISDESIRKVFEPFFTDWGSSHPTASESTGLGLTIAKGIMTENKGDILLLRNSDQGVTTAFIKLPYAPDPSTRESYPDNIATTPPISSILVIDEEAFLSDMLVDYLRSKDYNVLTSTDTEKILHFIDLHHPELVIIDTRQTTPNAFELADTIRKRDPRAKLIFATMGITSDEEKQAHSIGHAILSKPFFFEEVDRAINQAFQKE